MKKARLFVVVITRFFVVACVACALIGLGLFVPILAKKEKRSSLHGAFVGEKADLQGVIELWNIDTFEGGTASRAGWLSARAVEFEKQNLGLYVLVKSVTESELETAFKNNVYPDLISFGSGVEGLVEGQLSALSNGKFVDKNFSVQLLKFGGNVVAVPFCYSTYALFSTQDRFEKAGASGALLENLTTSGYAKKIRKKERSIYSCIYGGSGKTSPLSALGEKLSAKTELGVFPESKNLTSFEAYSAFVSGKANILVGTLRDLARLENKVLAGTIGGLMVEALDCQTDMVCYLGAIKNSSALENKYAQKFIEFCLSDNVQLKVKNMGLLSPTIHNLYGDGEISKIEKAQK